MNDSAPLVSVIVPAYNASATIEEVLKSLRAQDYPNLEIVVISDGSLDHTAEVVTRFEGPGLRLLERNVNRGLAVTLMDGLENSTGQFVMFLHADCRLGCSSWIGEAVRHFQDPNVAWVTGYYETLDLRCTRLVDQAFAVLRGEMLLSYQTRENGVRPTPFAAGKCDILRRQVIDDVGGMETFLRRSGEDQMLSYAVREAGWIILKDSSLVVEQRYARGAQPFSPLLANLRKEFVMAKTQAVAGLTHWRTILKDVSNRSFLARKGSHPIVKALAFAVFVGALLLTATTRSALGLAPMGVVLSLLVAYYLWKCRYAGVKLLSPLPPMVVGLGIISAIPYGIGLLWGTVRYLLKQARLYTRPI